jgi:iron(III) transport system permease protein
VGPLHNVRDSIEEASVSLGVPPLQIVLYYGGMSTMPIEIFQQVDSGRLALASAYSVILMLAIFIPLAAAQWAFNLKLDATQ